MGLFGSDSASSSTTAQQPTANSDAGSMSTVTNLGPITAGKGSDIAVNIQSLDRDIVDASFDFAGSAQEAANSLASESTGRAFDFLDARAVEMDYRANRAASVDADLAAKAFALADEKTTSTDERVLNLGKIGLLVGAALLGLFLLFFRPSRKA